MAVTITERAFHRKVQENLITENWKIYQCATCMYCLWESKLPEAEIAIPTASTRCQQSCHLPRLCFLVKRRRDKPFVQVPDRIFWLRFTRTLFPDVQL